MTLADDSDIFGPPKRGPGRPRKPPKPPRQPKKRGRRPLFAQEPGEVEFSARTVDLHNVVTGVSVVWLSRAFRMSRAKITMLLADCRPIRTHKTGGAIYDLPEAARFLVKPRTDIAAYVRSLKPEELPDEIRESFWSAKLKEQKWRANAGELWPTELVLEVLGETFKSIKSTVQLWTDTVDESIGLSVGQRTLVTQLSDRLLDDLHKALIVDAKSKATPSQIAEMLDAPEGA